MSRSLICPKCHHPCLRPTRVIRFSTLDGASNERHVYECSRCGRAVVQSAETGPLRQFAAF